MQNTYDTKTIVLVTVCAIVMVLNLMSDYCDSLGWPCAEKFLHICTVLIQCNNITHESRCIMMCPISTHAHTVM